MEVEHLHKLLTLLTLIILLMLLTLLSPFTLLIQLKR